MLTNIPENLKSLNTTHEEVNFSFFAIEDSSHYSNIFTKENFKTLEKWGLINNMELVKFRFNMNLDLKDLDRFLKDLFNDKNVRANFQPVNNVFAMLPDNKNKIENIKYKKLMTKSTNLDIFNILYESELVTGDNGYIQKDYEEYYEEIHIADKLKQALILEESEFYCTFDEDLRNEFLFHLFKRLVIGGSLCQYEDHIGEYLEMTKAFYKGKIYLFYFNLCVDLVTASKDQNTKEIVIRSIALDITDLEKSNLFRVKNHPQNFFYVVIDPYQRHVHLWYHKWTSMWKSE